MTNRLNAFIESMGVICCIHSRLAEEAILFAAWKLIWYVQKKRKDHTFWRQFDEKPSVEPGCPVSGVYIQAYMLLMFVFKPHLNETTEAIGVADLSCMLACLKHEHLKSKQV